VAETSGHVQKSNFSTVVNCRWGKLVAEKWKRCRVRV